MSPTQAERLDKIRRLALVGKVDGFEADADGRYVANSVGRGLVIEDVAAKTVTRYWSGPTFMHYHYHSSHETLEVVKGTGTYRVMDRDGREVESRYKPGDVLRFGPFVPHSFTIESDTEFHIVWVPGLSIVYRGQPNG